MTVWLFHILYIDTVAALQGGGRVAEHTHFSVIGGTNEGLKVGCEKHKDV